MKRAYSYIRFSSKQQARGASLERQIKATQTYCKANGLLLDESLSFQDLGVSAFKGGNRRKGLGEFLEACKAGLVEPGSAFVVESIDRLSRQRPRIVASLFGQLLDDFGLELHLTSIGRVMKPDSDSAAEEGSDLIIVTAMAIRAAEEQETKSLRLRDAFARKRQRLGHGDGIHYTKPNVLPWWIEHDAENKRLVCPPDRAAVLRRIFESAAAGMSSPQIARDLQAAKFPTYSSRSKNWRPETVCRTINAKSVEGLLVASKSSLASGTKFDPIPGFYPVIIEQVLVEKARASLATNRWKGRSHEERTADPHPVNILRHLLRMDDRWCKFDSQRKGKKRLWRSYFSNPDPASRKVQSLVSAQLVEATLLAGLLELTPADLLLAVNTIDPDVALLESERSRLEETTRAIGNLVKAIELGGEFDALMSRLRELEGRKIDLTRKIAQLSAKVERPVDEAGLEQRLQELKSVLDADLSDNQHRERIARALRAQIARVELFLDSSPSKRGLMFRAMLEGNAGLIADPCPPRKLRKAMTLVVHFRAGGRRAIVRLAPELLAKMGHENVLFTGRAEA